MGSDIFVISDLHMGDGGPRDNFALRGRAEQLERFVEHVGRAGGELVILGDLFEFWQMNLSRLLRGNRRILDRFAEIGAVYVPGNHDVDLAHFVGSDDLAHPFFRRMSLPFSRQLGGKTFHFFHGHEVDPFNRGDDPNWGRMLSIFAGLFEEENGSPLLKSGESVELVLTEFGDSMLDLWSGLLLLTRHRLIRKHGANPEMTRSLTPAQNPDRLEEHVEQVRLYLGTSGHDVGVLGHTHKAGRIGDWYYNSGTWTGPQNPFLRVRPTGEVGYFLWDGAGPVEQSMPVAWQPPEKPRHLKLPKPVVAARDTAHKLFPNLRLQRPPPAKRLIVAQGVLAIVAGALALALWGRGVDMLIFLFACYALGMAGLDLLAARRERSLFLRLFDYARAGVNLLFALVTLLRPGFSMGLLFFLIGAWGLGVGCLKIVEATVLGARQGRSWTFVSGLATAVMGVVLMTWPGRDLLTMAWLLWAWTLFAGASQVVAGLWGRTGQRWWFAVPSWRTARPRA